MKKILTALCLLSLLAVSGCADMPGTSAGALAGGLTGAVLDRRNPVAGALLGGAGGALIGNLFDNTDRGYRNNSRYGGRYDDRRFEEAERRRRFERQREYEEQRAYQEHERRERFEAHRRFEEERYYRVRPDCYRC